ncbi:zinc ribbon domain-containing protein [Methanolacinia petrolearia]|uniref:zinc ribbon domain-containing protein n=1 Tax=Methanolacinia petrolearia TaxID=54120 RepID=UPI003BABD6FD
MKNNAKTCQSCGMPMTKPEDFGTEADGSSSVEYCMYCYQNGSFTEPDITMEEMAEKGGAIMSQMFEIPAEKAVGFAKEQLSCLKRWAGREIKTCKSCGMPLARDEDYGTEENGSKSSKYCIYCYKDGKFIEPDLTKEEAVEKYAPMMAEHLGMPLEKAKMMVNSYLSSLPRWQ